jgi:hypothetical protein
LPLYSIAEVADNCYVGGLHQRAVDGDGSKNLTIQDDLDPFNALAFGFPLKFGCQTRLTGLFKTQLADGIMGMDNADAAFFSQMSKNVPGIARTFSLCFSRSPTASREGTGAGAMTLGGKDERLHDTSMVYATTSESRGFYNVHVRNIYLRAGGGESALSTDANAKIVKLSVSESDLNRGDVIVDSGTTDTYYHNSIARDFQDKWEAMAGKSFGHSAISLTEKELNMLPTILIQMQGQEDLNRKIAEANGHLPMAGLAGELDPVHPYDVILAIPASHYYEYEEKTGLYTNRFYTDEGGGSVLGANSMMGHDVFFGVDDSVVGWAESKCEYEALVKPFVDAADLVPVPRKDPSGLPVDNHTSGAGADIDGHAGIADDGDNNAYSDSHNVASSGAGFCSGITCQALFAVAGILAVSMFVFQIVKKARLPRYSPATMSELELQSTVEYRDSEFS